MFPLSLADENARLEALRRLDVLDTPTEATFERITALAARLFNVPMCLVSLVDDERQWFKSHHGLDICETPRNLSFCAHALQQQHQVLIVPDAALDPRFSDNTLVTGEPFIRFYAGAPLVSREGQSLGSLCILDRQPRQLNPEERKTLQDLASVVVDELELRLATRQLRQEAQARREAQQELLDSQRLFKSAFQMSATGMALVSLSGQWLQVNEKLCQLLGYNQDELLDGKSFQDVTYPEDLEGDLELVGQLLAGDIASYELEKRYVRKDESLIWACINVALVQGEKTEPLYFTVQVQDISMRKQMEEELRRSEARNTAIVETALDGIVTIDEHSRVVEWNPAAEKIFGFPRAQALGCDLRDLILPPNLRDSHRVGNNGNFTIGNKPVLGQRVEFPALRADERTIMVELAIVAIPDSTPCLFTAHVRDITKQRAIQERLRLLESVAVNANDAILITEAEPIDEPGPRILYANEAYCRMCGYSLEEILGKNPRILQGEGTSEETRAEIRHALKKWKPVVTEILNYKKDGTPFWVELSITPVANEKGWFTHWVSIQRDITERRQTLEALRESEARFHRIAAKVPGMVYQVALSPGGLMTFNFVSDGCRDLYEVEPAQFVVNPFLVSEYTHPDDLESLHSSITNSARTLEPWAWQGRMVLPDGRIKWIRGTSRPKREADGRIIWDGILFDITPSIRNVEALQSAKQEAEAARAEAERANAAKSEFLSRMSHELRTPLNAILGFSQLLQIAPLQEEDKQSTEQIVKAGRHLLNLINEVLDLARIEAGEVSISPEFLGVRDILLEALDLVRPLASARRISIDDTGVRQCPLGLVADRQRLKQILLNLLSNAVKYNQEGGTITVTAQESGDCVRLSVSDSGPGIASENMERLWVPFDRLGAEYSSVEGTGVGLAVSQTFARAMGSELQVSSELHRGSTFWLDLPRAALPESHLGRVAPPPAVSITSTDLVVLYIEDNAANLQLVEKLLSHRPEIRLLTAMQGALGCEMAFAHRPDLILLDMHLPDLSGVDVLQQLQCNTATSSIPVVVLSADVSPGQVHRALEAGAYDFLSKPLDVQAFFSCLDEMAHQKTLWPLKR